MYLNIKKASENSWRLMKFLQDQLSARRKDVVSMTASIKSNADKTKKRLEQQKLKEQREQARLAQKVVAKANGSPSKGISMVLWFPPKMSAR